jgi:DNA-directed RNA polymerase subunit RPC12/RpoP
LWSLELEAMAIAFRCRCGKSYRVSEMLAGRYAFCRRCRTRLLIPGQWAETLNLPPPAVIGPFGFIAFLFSLTAIVCAIILPWPWANWGIQAAALLFACSVLLAAGYYNSGFILPLLSAVCCFIAFGITLVVPDALERLWQFRQQLLSS